MVKPRITIYLISLVILLFSFICAMYGDYQPTFRLEHAFNEAQLNQVLLTNYFPAKMHLASYLIGVMLGFMLHDPPKYQSLISAPTKRTVLLIATLVTLAIGVPTWHLTRFEAPDHLKPLLGTVFNGYYRTLWAATVAYVIAICVAEHHGKASQSPVARSFRRFLEWPYFRPISRLTFSFLMTHSLLVHLRSATMRSLLDAASDPFYYFAMINALFGLSLTFACFAYVIYERPLLQMGKTLLLNQSQGMKGSFQRPTHLSKSE